MSSIGVVSLSAVVSCALTWIIILFSGRLFDRLPRPDDRKAVQSAHTVPTPRIGGIGVLVATLAGLLAGVSTELSPVVFCLAVSVVPVFAAGLAEDLGFRVSPSGRLAAAAISAVLMILLQKLWITGLGFLWLDQLFLFSPIAIFLTIVWSAGIQSAETRWTTPASSTAWLAVLWATTLMCTSRTHTHPARALKSTRCAAHPFG